MLLAASLHETFNILSSYRERMADWTGVLRAWKKEKKEKKTMVDNLMDNLADNKDVNKDLLRRANRIYDEISAIFLGLDRITQSDEKFNSWRDMTPAHLEKLIEEFDQRVNAFGRVSYEGFGID